MARQGPEDRGARRKALNERPVQGGRAKRTGARSEWISPPQLAQDLLGRLLHREIATLDPGAFLYCSNWGVLNHPGTRQLQASCDREPVCSVVSLDLGDDRKMRGLHPNAQPLSICLTIMQSFVTAFAVPLIFLINDVWLRSHGRVRSHFTKHELSAQAAEHRAGPAIKCALQVGWVNPIAHGAIRGRPNFHGTPAIVGSRPVALTRPTASWP
jgi:hypothetical protein